MPAFSCIRNHRSIPAAVKPAMGRTINVLSKARAGLARFIRHSFRAQALQCSAPWIMRRIFCGSQHSQRRDQLIFTSS